MARIAIWVTVLGNAQAIFPYDHPALFSMPRAFLVIVVVSKLDRSARAERFERDLEAWHDRKREVDEQQRKRADAEAKRNAPKVEKPTNEPKQGRRLTVFKDAQGKHRWIARTTTAYRDRDGEIISMQALEKDAARMTATGQYGPLRWWHVGEPDPTDPVAPWGPGIDIGDCDFSIVIGRTSLESGTFKSETLGDAFAASADEFELSPGFFHPINHPNDAGEFDDIRRFERSAVPTAYARASNLFTGLTVKEHRMDPDVYEQRVKTFLAFARDNGIPPETAASSLTQMERSDKDAARRGIAFKSSDAQPVYTAPDGTQGIIQDGQFVTLKAAPPPMADEAVVEETKAPGDMPMELDAEIEPEPEMDADVIGNLPVEDFFARLDERLAPVLRLQEMVKSIGDTHAELKTMYGGAATKDDSRAQELAALKSQLATIQAQIAQISGDQPALVLTDEVAAALKSAGPEAPAQPDTVVIPNDPNRPFAGLAAQTFPQLYYSDQGWQAKPS